MFMEWLKKAPTSVTITVVVTCGLLIAVLVASFVVLELEGADTEGFRSWVNTLGTLLGFPLMGTAAVAGIAAARSSSRAEDQTNGQLHDRDDRIRQLENEVRKLRGLRHGDESR
jgi:hypothetical protein